MLAVLGGTLVGPSTASRSQTQVTLHAQVSRVPATVHAILTDPSCRTVDHWLTHADMMPWPGVFIVVPRFCWPGVFIVVPRFWHVFTHKSLEKMKTLRTHPSHPSLRKIRLIAQAPTGHVSGLVPAERC